MSIPPWAQDTPPPRPAIRDVARDRKGRLIQVRILDPGCQHLDDRELRRLFRVRRDTRARLARLTESYVITVKCGSDVSAVAAYKMTARNICVLHELVIYSHVARQRDCVVEVILDALEADCCANGRYAVIILRTDIAPTVFRRYGYAVSIDRCGGAWLHKSLSPRCADQIGHRALR